MDGWVTPHPRPQCATSTPLGRDQVIAEALSTLAAESSEPRPRRGSGWERANFLHSPRPRVMTPPQYHVLPTDDAEAVVDIMRAAAGLPPRYHEHDDEGDGITTRTGGVALQPAYSPDGWANPYTVCDLSTDQP